MSFQHGIGVWYHVTSTAKTISAIKSRELSLSRWDFLLVSTRPTSATVTSISSRGASEGILILRLLVRGILRPNAYSAQTSRRVAKTSARWIYVLATTVSKQRFSGLLSLIQFYDGVPSLWRYCGLSANRAVCKPVRQFSWPQCWGERCLTSTGFRAYESR
jgi:hypothetical protein